MNWVEFEPFFKKKLESFILHKAANHRQKYARDKIYNTQEGNILLSNSDISASIDYIENVKAQSQKMPISMFKNAAQIAFCEIYQTTLANNELFKVGEFSKKCKKNRVWSFGFGVSFLNRSFLFRITHLFPNKIQLNFLKLNTYFFQQLEFSCAHFKYLI